MKILENMSNLVLNLRFGSHAVRWKHRLRIRDINKTRECNQESYNYALKESAQSVVLLITLIRNFEVSF